MIIHKDFIWMHFPRCAGTFTEQLLHKYYSANSDIAFDEIDPGNVIWHQSVVERENNLGVKLSGRDIICNFRRLPYWIISRIRYEKKRAGIFYDKELYTRGIFNHRKGYQRTADMVLSKYLLQEVHSWIRVEYLEIDFMKVFSKYLDVQAKVQKSDFESFVNASGGKSNLDEWFTPEDLNRIYNACPLWAKTENEVYGNILI